MQTGWLLRTAFAVESIASPHTLSGNAGGSGKIYHPVFDNHTKTTDDVPYSWSLPYYHPPPESDQKYANLTHTFWPVPGNVTDQMPDNYIAGTGIQMLVNVTTNPQFKNVPFFIAVGVHRPHLPFNAPEHYWDLYPLSSIPMPKWPYRPHDYGDAINFGWDPQSGPRHTEDIQALNISFPDGYIPLDYGQKMKQAYLSAVSYTDTNMGMVLQTLKDTGKYDETTIVFIGDHGWQLGEHGEWGKKTTWDRSVTAPLMIKPAKTAAEAAASPSKAKFQPDFAQPGSTFRRRLGVDLAEGAPAETAAEAEARRAVAIPAALEQYRATLEASLVKSSAYVEFAGIYPTLAELSGLPVPPTCPAGSAGMHNTTCIESASFAGAVRLAQAGSPVQAGQALGGAPAAAFGQYPHCMHDVNEPGFYGCHDPNLPGMQPRYMGYTILAQEAGAEWRYTRWVNFTVATATPQWEELLAEELYNRTADPTEDFNVVADAATEVVHQALNLRLLAGWRGAL